jgi:hypothetical protein
MHARWAEHAGPVLQFAGGLHAGDHLLLPSHLCLLWRKIEPFDTTSNFWYIDFELPRSYPVCRGGN